MRTFINQVATISSVELSDSLKDWNESNEAFRVRILFSYVSSEKEDKEEGVLSLADFEAEGASVGKTYNCLINFDAATKKYDERSQEKALESLKEKFEGKKARFSSFDATISDLTEEKETVINNGERAYTALSNSYLGKVDDVDGEIKKLQRRLKDMLDDDFEFGELKD